MAQSEGFFWVKMSVDGGMQEYLAQQWPASYYCNHVEVTININFTSLWPFDSSEHQLDGCELIGSNYKTTYVSAIKNDLAKAWPNFDNRGGGVDEDFWRHEWNRHGKCSEKVLVGADYFQTTLNLKNKFDIFDILRKSDIKAKEYDVKGIRYAIRKATGVDAKVVCKNPNLLSEITLS